MKSAVWSKHWKSELFDSRIDRYGLRVSKTTSPLPEGVAVRIIRRGEIKGLLVISAIVAVLVFFMFVISGTIAIRTPWSKRISNSIVFISDRSGHPNVWQMNPDGSQAKALTDGDFEDSSPVVSPDGSLIAFLSRRDTTQNQVYLMDADGSHQHRITIITGTKSDLQFTPDGKHLVFVCAGEIWQVAIRGNHVERLLPTNKEIATSRANGRAKPAYLSVSVSLTGNLVAAVQSIDEGEGQLAVWLKPGEDMPVPVVGLTEAGGAPLAGESVRLAWMPNECELVITLTTQEGIGMLLMVDPESGNVRPLIPNASLGAPIWSPDGSRIAVTVTERVGPGEYTPMGLLILEESSQNHVAVEDAAKDVRWSSDGTRLAFTKDKDICVVEAESGEVLNITKGKGKNSQPFWAPTVK